MREIEGYVHVVGDTIYGPRGSFEGSGLLTFRTVAEAIADSSIRHDAPAEVYSINLTIVETEADLKVMKRKWKIVIVLLSSQPNDASCQILGPRIPNRPHIMDGAALFSQNGHRTFRTYSGAAFVAEDIARQSASPVRLACLIFNEVRSPRITR